MVLEYARLKALELEAQNCGIEIGSTQSPNLVSPSYSAPLALLSRPDTVPSSSIPAAHLIWRAIESYLQEIVATAVRSQLATLGVMPQGAIPLGEVGKTIEATALKDQEGRESVHPSPQPVPDGKVMIADAIESYLKDVEPPQREQKTYDEDHLVLSKFRETCSKRYLHEVNRDDCLSFMRHLDTLGNEARTVFNRVGIVLQLLKLHGIKGLLKKRDKPKFVVNVREMYLMYQPEELEALFKACTADERVLYLFFLLTGERAKEVQYTAWPDINCTRKCVRVTAKKQLGFKPKDKEEREIPAPTSLLTALQEYKARRSGSNPHNLVLPTAGGKPDKKFENKLKRIANRAGTAAVVSRNTATSAQKAHIAAAGFSTISAIHTQPLASRAESVFGRCRNGWAIVIWLPR